MTPVAGVGNSVVGIPVDALPDDAIVYYMSYDQIAVVFEIPSGEVHPRLDTLHPPPFTLHPSPSTFHPPPSARNLEPITGNPEP